MRLNDVPIRRLILRKRGEDQSSHHVEVSNERGPEQDERGKGAQSDRADEDDVLGHGDPPGVPEGSGEGFSHEDRMDIEHFARSASTARGGFPSMTSRFEN